MKESVDTLVAVLGLAVGVIGGIASFFFWYKASIEKNYAAQRDFNHLRKNQEQLIQNIDYLFKEIDRRFDGVDSQMIELKGMLFGTLRKRNESE